MLGRYSHVGGRADSAKRKSHETEQLPGLRIEQRGIHPIAAAQVTVRPEPDPDPTRAKQGAGDDPERRVAAHGNMVRRMRHYLSVRLLRKGLLGEFNGL